jgi:hypothetical protein
MLIIFFLSLTFSKESVEKFNGAFSDREEYVVLKILGLT